MNDRMTGWSAMRDDGGLNFGVFPTRQELIQYQCWNLGEVVENAGSKGSLSPWLHTDDKEVSKAWRRLKRKYGMRAVPVVVMPAEEAGDA